MGRVYPLSRRRLLAGAGGLALGLWGIAARADDATPLRLGVLTDMSSLYADITGPGSLAAAKMAVEDFQASPHKMTRPIEVLSGDHMNKADLGANIAREWIDRNNVDAIIDVPNSAVALAVRNVVQQANKTLLVSGASSSDLTGKACSPNLVHWSYDTYALSTGTARAVLAEGGKTWFTLTADYAFGHAMEAEVKNVVQKGGGTVVGGVRTPINTQDFSSFLLQAQASKAQVIGLINAGGDTINSIKQSVEFGIVQGGQRVVATVLYLSDVHSLGLKIAQGLQFTESFYWGHERRHARLGQALRAAQQWPLSDRDAGRRLRRNAALSQGGRRAGRFERWQGRGAGNEDAADRRSPVRQGHGARRWPQAAQHVFVRGQEAGRVEISL